MSLYTASDVIQFTYRRLGNDTSTGLVHRTAAESGRIRVLPSQGRGESVSDKLAIDGSVARETVLGD